MWSCSHIASATVHVWDAGGQPVLLRMISFAVQLVTMLAGLLLLRGRKPAERLLLAAHVWLTRSFILACITSLVATIMLPLRTAWAQEATIADNSTAAVIATGVCSALRSLCTEGCALFLVQYSASRRPLRRAVRLAAGCALCSGALAFGVALRKPSAAQGHLIRTLAMFWVAILATAFGALALVPETVSARCAIHLGLYRRPYAAARYFALFWAVRYMLRLGELLGEWQAADPASGAMGGVSIGHPSEYGACCAVTAELLCALGAAPLLLTTLVADSRFWLGRRRVARSPRLTGGGDLERGGGNGGGGDGNSSLTLRKESSISSVLSGIALDPHTACAVAQFEDELERMGRETSSTATAEVIACGVSHVQLLPHRLLSIGRKIWGGGAAQVYQGAWRGEPVALKVKYCMDITPETVSGFCYEAAVHARLSAASPHVLRLHGICVLPPSMALVFKLCRCSVNDLLHTDAGTRLKWLRRLRMMRDCVRAVCAIHANGMLHNDIKSHNFLVDDADAGAGVRPVPRSRRNGNGNARSTSRAGLVCEEEERELDLADEDNFRCVVTDFELSTPIRPDGFSGVVGDVDPADVSFVARGDTSPSSPMGSSCGDGSCDDMRTALLSAPGSPSPPTLGARERVSSPARFDVRPRNQVTYPPPASAGALKVPIPDVVNWLCPEAILGEPLTTKSDVYSLAMLLFEIAANEIPFKRPLDRCVRAAAGQERLRRICIDNERPQIPASFPPDFECLLQSAWDRKPEYRMTADKMAQQLDEMYQRYTRRFLWPRTDQAAGARLDPSGSGMSSGVSSAGSDEELDLDTSVGGQTHGPTFVNRASQNSWTARDGSFADANELDGTDEQERLAAWRRDHENDAYLQAQGTNDDASATVQLVSEHEMSGGRFVQ